MTSASRVQQVTRRLRGFRSRRAYSTQRDRLLAQRLYDLFEQELVLAEIRGLNLYVFKGSVAIYGMIHHELDEDLIVSLIRQVPGVKEVNAHLKPVAGGTPPRSL